VGNWYTTTVVKINKCIVLTIIAKQPLSKCQPAGYMQAVAT